MKLVRPFLWHWRADSSSPIWLADAEIDLSKFSQTAAVTFAADVVMGDAGTLSVGIATGGLAETVGTTTVASATQAGPFIGSIAGVNVAGVEPSQGKILLHLSASVTAGAAELRNIFVTISDE